MQLAPDQLATVLAALRYYQQQGLGDPDLRPDAIHDIATDHGQVVSLDAEGIDELCEALNTAELPPSAEATAFIRTVATMKMDDECYDAAGRLIEDTAAAEAAGIQPFEMSFDDAFSTLHAIISDARRIAALLPAAPSEDLADLLLQCLPFLEEAEKDPAYKKGFVAQLIRRIRNTAA